MLTAEYLQCFKKGTSRISEMGTFLYKVTNTDKKENQIFLIYKEIQSGAVAKSYMTKGLLIMGNYLCISASIRKPFLKYDFATAAL